MKIDHIAIAVNDVEVSAKIYQKALGIDEIEFETVESEGVKVAIIPMENGRIELIQPELFALDNRFQVSFFEGNRLFDKTFIFKANSIKEGALRMIKQLQKKGVICK